MVISRCAKNVNWGEKLTHFFLGKVVFLAFEVGVIICILIRFIMCTFLLMESKPIRYSRSCY